VDHCPHSDKILGLNEPISRRDFIDGTLVASTVGAACPVALGAQSRGASPAGWSGYDTDISSAEWFDDFSRSANVRKNASFGVDTDGVGRDLPTVLTFCVDFAKPGRVARAQGQLGRAELLSTPFVDYERQVREQTAELLGASGFDGARDIAGIVLNRFGHTLINPQPGCFLGLDRKPAAREAVRNDAFGGIAFFHSDLTGAIDPRNAFMESQRAASQPLDRVLIS
jgi:spermidine dehydrogenase